MTVEDLPDTVAVRTKDDEVSLTWAELRDRVDALAGGLAKLGVKKDDTVALMFSNRPEFHIADLAVMTLGATPFSLYATLSPEQIQYVMQDAGAKIALIEEGHLEQVDGARKIGLRRPRDDRRPGGRAGRGHRRVGRRRGLGPRLRPRAALARARARRPAHADLHERHHRAAQGRPAHPQEPDDRGGERSRTSSSSPRRGASSRGCRTRTSPSAPPTTTCRSSSACPSRRARTRARSSATCPPVKPTWFFAVPRIWEKLRGAMLGGVFTPGSEDREHLDAAIKKVELEQAGEEVPSEVAETAAKGEEKFAQVRGMLGLDEAVAVNAGAAPTPPEVILFFHAIGIPLGELWGMSETCGAGTVNPPDKIKIGTVGPAVKGVEIRLADDGEVLMRSDVVMGRGYRNLPDKTAEAIDDDGWLHTGDIGQIDDDGYLQDRRPQEGDHHQRGRQEHVAGQHRGDGQVRLAADRLRLLHRRRQALQHGAARPGRRHGARVGGAERHRGHVAGGARRQREDPRRAAGGASTPPTPSSPAWSRSSTSRCSATGCRAATS